MDVTAVGRPYAPSPAPDVLPRLLRADGPPTLAGHVERWGPAPRRTAGLIAEVEHSGLRGKGGAGFPTAVKMAAVAARRGGFVVANGTEGEPTSTKDKSLLLNAPHLVLDGAVLAAQAVGADSVVVCVDRAATGTLAALAAAEHERGAARIDPIAIRVAATPTRYLAGEESALVHWLNGGDAKPTVTPPRPFERGVRGRSTLVQNVETLAHLALIARYGAQWFRALGTGADPGSTLLTVSGGLARPGVYEVALGTPLQSVMRAAGRPSESSGAVLVGGYCGTWLPAAAVDQVRFSQQSLGGFGASQGCGAVVALPDSACGLAESARVTRWLSDQTADQCGPCVHGLDAIAWAMEVLVRGDINGNAERQLDRWLDQVKGRGACRHPDGAAHFVESSLYVFADEIAAHRRRGPCPPLDGPVLPVPQPEGWR
jgi:NADH:ubiquinone oxidoreductase subunit F (NADH-binding)